MAGPPAKSSMYGSSWVCIYSNIVNTQAKIKTLVKVRFSILLDNIKVDISNASMIASSVIVNHKVFQYAGEITNDILVVSSIQ